MIDEFHEIALSTPNSDRKGELEQRKYEGEHKRNEGLKNVIHRIITVLAWFGFICIIIILSIRIIHLISPCSWYWLKTDKINEIDRFLFSGAIGGFVARYITVTLKK